MEFLEKDLEEIIFEADRKDLSDRGLKITGKLYRQLRIGNYGIADLVSIKRSYCNESLFIIPELIITVFELKKDKIGVSAFLQALGYVKGIDSFMKLSKPSICVKFKIVLIGKTLDGNSSYSYLVDYVEGDFLTNYTYNLGIAGLTFESHENYGLIEDGFNFKTSGLWEN